MKRFIFILFSLLVISIVSPAQTTETMKAAEEQLNKRGEVYFKFILNSDQASLEDLSRIISIDNKKGSEIYAYANKKEFTGFLEYGLNFELLTPPSMIRKPRMLGVDERETDDWDYYPTYEEYIALMEQFEMDHSDLCELVNFGQSVEDRDLLAIHISNNLGEDENEPEFFYTSSMHGDELTGYVLMLHLIDYLLNNYGLDDQVTNLVDNIDIWINPLANPDGTYAGGNNTVWGATRYNANWVDLNRNYPDPEDGQHPDGNEWQTETVHFMDFADEHDFVMSANFHGGAEVLNYPWDTWYTLHPDDAWWIYVCRQYADTVHLYGPAGYMNDLNNGITNGAAWYSISGGRQDYMNYFQHCREVTIELSSNKTPPANQLPGFWEYSYRSLLNYMEQALYGFRGVITDAYSGDPLNNAQVFIEDHDEDESQVYSTFPVGNYHRPIKAGSYEVSFSRNGYYPQTIDNLTTTDENILILDVQLVPVGAFEANFEADNLTPSIEDTVFFTDLSNGTPTTWEWSFTPDNITYLNGTNANSQNPVVAFNAAGSYSVQLTASNEYESDTEVKTDYIIVSELPPVADFTATPLSGTVPLTVNFSDQSEGVIDTWQWDFGDGSNSSEQNPEHIYTEVNIFTVTLTVTGPGGSNTLVKENYINTSDMLSVFVSANPDIICLYEESQLQAHASGGSGNYTFSWTSVPPGFSSEEQNPVVSPEVTTTYTVEVNDGEQTVSSDVLVTVNPLPEIILGTWPEQLCNQQEPPVQLTATPEGGVYTGENVSETGLFSPDGADTGWYVITYSFTDTNGCQANAQDSIFVDDCLNFEEENYKKGHITIYPNPFTNRITIDVPQGDFKVSIMGIEGSTIIKEHSLNDVKTINLNFLKPGIYMIRIGNGQEAVYQKIIKN